MPRGSGHKRGARFGLVATAILLQALGPATATVSVEFASERVIVGFPGSTPRAVRDAIHRRLGATVERSIDALDADIVRVAARRVRAAAELYRQNPLVRYAEPDHVARSDARTNDPELAKQQSLVKIQAASASATGTSAWDLSTGSPAVSIALLDSGVQIDHPDLAGKVTLSANLTSSPTDRDVLGHGTAVAGIAGAATHNAVGVAGVGYAASLISLKVLGDDGNGFYSWIGDGIRRAADLGAKVINLSLSGSAPSQFLHDSVNYAWAAGAVVVAAAGNHATTEPHYPASYSNAIAVASTNLNDQRSSFSAYGSWVDVAAPGGDGVYTTDLVGTSGYGPSDYEHFSGTSAATPHVAGVAALLWASGRCTTNTCVRDSIERSADHVPGTGTSWAHGRINAAVALQIAPPPERLAVPVASGADDAEERLSTGKVTINSDLELGNDGSRAQRVGLRFRARIPQGADVVNAHVQFKTDEVSNGSASLTIHGQAADNAAAFTTATSNLSARPRTAASVTWSPANWPTVGAAGVEQRTPDLAPIIEEIVARANWSPDNHLVLTIAGAGRRTAVHQEGGGAPVLHVEYATTPQPQSPAVTITSPAVGARFASGASIGFEGSSRSEAGDLSGSLAWTSSLDGMIGSGGSFTRRLSDGAHTITASVADAAGRTGQASVSIVIGTPPQTLDVSVASANDDAEERASNGSMSLGSSDLELGADGSNAQRVGLRFIAAIPKGARITSAYVQFRVDEASTGATALTISGQAADNASGFTSATGNVGSRALTSSTVSWSPASWPTVGAAGADQRTPDIAPIIQQIVDRSGWESGNGLVLVVTGTGRRTADAYEDGYGTILHVEYTI